ncbi:MAG: M20/M25/M40 family metallo-hydrolase [Candidatus Micrarchaeota archaeon]|nr:M20/M25/M40 family metallo-hydrolase [Candidatus Micrarchaeota archaeon]
MKVTTITKELVNRSSITKNGEGEVGMFIASLMHDHGFKVITQNVKHHGATGFNVLATRGDSLNLLLQSHMDTVEPDIKVDEDENAIYGRGACDAKGPLGSMLGAAIRASKEGLTNFGVLATVDEEETFSGAFAAVDLLKPLKPKAIIGGEPTEFKVVGTEGLKGNIYMTVGFNGENTHVGKPGEKNNALVKMSKAVIALQDLNDNHALPFDKRFGQTILNPTGVERTPNAENVIPAEAVLTVDVRTSVNNETVLSQIMPIITKIDPRARTEIKLSVDPLPPVDIEAFNLETLKKLEIVSGVGVQSYVAEPHAWFRAGIPAVIVGPGDTALAHQPNEHILKSDLLRGEDMYHSMLREACS